MVCRSSPALLAQPRLHDQRVARHADASAFFRRDCYLLEGDVGLGAADRAARLSGGYGQRVPGAGAGHHEPPAEGPRSDLGNFGACGSTAGVGLLAPAGFPSSNPRLPQHVAILAGEWAVHGYGPHTAVGRARLRAAHGCGPRNTEACGSSPPRSCGHDLQTRSAPLARRSAKVHRMNWKHRLRY